MVAHILGGQKPCPYASKAAEVEPKELRKRNQKGRKREMSDESEGEKEDTSEPKLSKKRKVLDRVETHQTKLKAYKGINIPFTEEQKKAIQAQFLRATVPAKLPFLWTEDPEVIKLFLMFRSAAVDVIPSRKVMSERLLKEESERVENSLRNELNGSSVTLTCDGVKDISKNALVGVSVSANFKPYMVDLFDATGDKKDGESMCEAFGKIMQRRSMGVRLLHWAPTMMGEVELAVQSLGTFVRGSFNSRAVHILAHQGQLVLADYFKASPEAAKTSEDATDLVGWINNHGRVRKIFDGLQQEIAGDVLKYIVGNLTRWTTHEACFKRLEDVKPALRTGAVSKRPEIINAQVGAEKNAREAKVLRTDAESHIDLIDDSSFWQQLSLVISDIEPITYATNISQSDHARPDVVLLAFVGMFLHFRNLPPARSSLSKEMTRRLERRWAGLNQPLMITALILNPYRHIDFFGPNASASILNLNKLVTDMFQKSINRPTPEFLDPDEQEELVQNRLNRVSEFSTAFLHYCACDGPFQEWKNQKSDFETIHGDDPIKFWQAMRTDGKVRELADFATKILSIVMNTASNERQFSQISSNLRDHHYVEGLKEVRKERKNHSDARIGELLAVPRYSMLLQGDLEADTIDGSQRWNRESLFRSYLSSVGSSLSSESTAFASSSALASALATPFW
ncbi:hypothetical protein K435DRAFT_874407 [Dendrothele bispora CBS 962.96]|uniref:HAT C-terminal dimerisation domain-containing protein n=1 Tax=Dendrothele bispora (strain CBS 962.96) TaxID=1314807 RepID=A0A4S8KXV7_DENBC|nr:hypothetical protein K435DRAFT_874407 [Dendrothele bispora CBS 962.96]